MVSPISSADAPTGQSRAASADLSRLRIDRTAPPPGRGTYRRNLILAALVLLALVVAYLVWGRATVPTVQVVTVSAGTGGGAAAGTALVTANGYVVARTKASVSAKIAGRLAYLGVSEGSFVQRGEVIARLDNAEFQAAIQQAEANIATADANVIEAVADRDQLARDVQRLRDVRAQNAMLVSQQEIDLAASRAAAADARLTAAEARKRAAQSGLRLAVANNENTIVRAPFTGTVLRKDAEVGEVVAPSVGGGLTRGAVVTMADLSTLEVEVDVNEAYIARIRSGGDARITLDAYPDTVFRGSVRQVVPTADRQRATVQVKVSILDSDPRILPEMGAKVDFLAPDSAGDTRAPRAAIRIPQSAVRTEGATTVVWIVREQRLVRREIQTGPVSGGFFEVRSGLSGGEQVVVQGLENPQEGMRVNIAGR